MPALVERRRRGGGKTGGYRPMAEINVTPFVDVMLVLLVVFMVTAPLLTVGVKVDLPKTRANSLQGQDQPLAVSIDKDGLIYLQDREVELAELVPRLKAITENAPETRIFVRGDNGIHYGRVLQVMSTINVAGFTRVALVAQSPVEESATDKTGTKSAGK
jgi:biopolymer transport protein TolR